MEGEVKGKVKMEAIVIMKKLSKKLLWILMVQDPRLPGGQMRILGQIQMIIPYPRLGAPF